MAPLMPEGEKHRDESRGEWMRRMICWRSDAAWVPAVAAAHLLLLLLMLLLLRMLLISLLLMLLLLLLL